MHLDIFGRTNIYIYFFAPHVCGIEAVRQVADISLLSGRSQFKLALISRLTAHACYSVHLLHSAVYRLANGGSRATSQPERLR